MITAREVFEMFPERLSATSNWPPAKGEILRKVGLNPAKYDLIPLHALRAWRVVRREVLP